MRKFYAFFTLLLVCVIPFLKTNAQVNYLFTASQSTYTPLVAGINPPLDNPTPTGYYEDDEGFANAVPLGFTFNFNNTNYTALNINVNGFVTFGTPFTMDVNDRYHTNNLTSGPKQDGIRPLIAPLWDDLRLQDNASLKYATQGTAPNRVFIVEWSNVSWNYNALAAAISFQMKLYESSNAIEFVYQPLSGSASNASASIGIATCSLCTGSFLSVGSIENATSVSGITEYDDIKVKPTAGTTYRFEPGVCSMPVALSMDKYNTRTATFSWGAASANIVGYDYAVTNSPLQPLTYASTTNNNVTVASLQPGTQYYMHVRSSNLVSKKSGWVTYTFKTACETTLPYKEGFENATAPKVPGCITVENPTGGNSWQISNMSNLPPYNNVITFSNDNNHQADGWFVLPAARLVGGNSYRIRFKYKVSDSAGINQKMEIRLGTELNSTFAGWNTVYKNTKLNETIFKDTSALFAPQVDGIYFIAFRCNSDKNTATLFIDDIEMSAVIPSPVKILSFSGSRSDTKNVLVWKTSSEINNKGFELQKGADGINFSTVAFINSKGINGNSTVALDYTQVDEQPFKGNTYYRLRIVDANNNEFYSQPIVIKATIPLEVEYSKVFPNPVKDIVTAVVAAPINTRGNFVIADMYGKVLVNMPVSVIKGDNVFKVDVSSLRNGVYMSKLVCLTGQQTEARTFIKQ